MNTSFLFDVCRRHGPFDVVIDDGGHTSLTIRKPLSVIFPSDDCMKNESVYVIEDMHTVCPCARRSENFSTAAPSDALVATFELNTSPLTD